MICDCVISGRVGCVVTGTSNYIYHMTMRLGVK